jgi:signal transduction histidine kinase
MEMLAGTFDIDSATGEGARLSFSVPAASKTSA